MALPMFIVRGATILVSTRRLRQRNCSDSCNSVISLCMRLSRHPFLSRHCKESDTLAIGLEGILRSKVVDNLHQDRAIAAKLVTGLQQALVCLRLDCTSSLTYYSTGNQVERFRFFELISRFEFEFRRCEFFLNDSNFWCVQKFNHVQ